MRSGICRIPVRVRGFVSDQSQYAYGIFDSPRTHMGTAIIPVWMFLMDAHFPFVTQAYLARQIETNPIMHRGSPRMHTGRDSHMGSPRTHNEMVPILGVTYISK